MKRIIVIGDLHGDYQALISILKMTNLINENLQWTGGKTIVVQVGDTLDSKRPDLLMDSVYKNSPEELKLFNFIDSLNIEARKQGGKVISILGNHELYTFYLDRNEGIDFSEKYVKEVDRNSYRKLGYSRWDYYSPGNPGSIRLAKTRPLLHKEGKFLFVHGSPTVEFIKSAQRKNGKIDINAVNKNVSDWLLGKREAPEYMSDYSNINPLFNRDLSQGKMSREDCKMYSGYLKHFDGIEYIIMGHTVHDSINSVCNDKFIRTDVAMSRAFGGDLKSKKDEYEILEILQPLHGSGPQVRVLKFKDGKVLKVQL